MKFRMPWRARDKSENSINGLFKRRMHALLVSAVSGNRRLALPPTGIITLSLSGA